MANLVSPLEATLAYLRQDADLVLLVGDRLAAKHKYGMGDEGTVRRGWAATDSALTLAYDGPAGDPDTLSCPDAAQLRVRLALRCWGASPLAADRVYRRAAYLVDAFTRSLVLTSEGDRALIYQLQIVDGPYSEHDPDIHMDMIRLALHVAVGRMAIIEGV